MSGMSRFRSMRRKDKFASRDESAYRVLSGDMHDLFTLEDYSTKPSRDDQKKINEIVAKLTKVGNSTMNAKHAEYALQTRYANGDVNKAFELLILFDESVIGILRPFDPNVPMLGAENRKSVSCYLDSVLFAMFARLDTFEGMLYSNPDDGTQHRLAIMLRLWVNMLRSGKLITTDITKHIQDALASAGWGEACKEEQQDASEAFNVITEILKLPLLTLKMDIYHTGKEDQADDHKYVNERLLDVAVPENPERQPVTLETCLENYFNNRIEVKRHLERRSTLMSTKSWDPEKAQAFHVETIDMDEGSQSSSPLLGTPMSGSSLPRLHRDRTLSIVRERVTIEKDELPESSPRKPSIRKSKEVLMPAWQFFSLIPWYTQGAPTNNLPVGTHFTSTRPVLGICLKRYSMDAKGKSSRLDYYIDIPTEIGLPHFISDDNMDDDRKVYGNFKLSLQSVVCHRGRSIRSGHYISLVRREKPSSGSQKTVFPGVTVVPPSQISAVNDDVWMLFDDFAEPRIRYVDIKKAMRDELPYLLFYQVQPIDESPIASPIYSDNPPAYSENDSGIVGMQSQTSLSSISGDMSRPSLELTDDESERRGRRSFDSQRRRSVAFSDENAGLGKNANQHGSSTLGPPQLVSGTLRPSRSRPTSQSGEGRLGQKMSKLGIGINKDRSLSHGDVATDSRRQSVMDTGIAKDVKLVKKEQRSKSKSKSKSRRGSGDESGHSHKHRSKDPDRECNVM